MRSFKAEGEARQDGRLRRTSTSRSAGFYDGNRRLVAQENLIDPALEALVSRTCVGLKLERDLLDFIHLNSMASVVRMSAAVVCIGEGAGGALRGYRHGTRMVALTPPRASSSSSSSSSSPSVGIFYATGTGNTKRVANSLKVHFGTLADEPQPISASNARDFEPYDAIIFGAPSYLWEKHRVSALDYDTIEPPFENLRDLEGTKVAVFGVGDQSEYPKNFCDAVGILHEHFSLRGAEMVGMTENEGYEFKRSRALKQGKLCGLALDFENAGDEVAGRVEAWAEQLKREFG